MTLSFNYKEDFIIDSQAARTNVKQLTKDFERMLEDNAMALAEIKALGDTETIDEMKRMVNSTLVDADPDSIVNGMLNIDPDPYEVYLEGQSAQRNKKLADSMFAKNEDRYKNTLQDFFNDQTLKSNLGEYHFELDSINHEAPVTSAYEVSVHHDNTMKPQIIVTATNQKQRVEEDVIGLDNFAQDIKPNYLKLDQHQLTNDLSNEYNKHIQDDYVPFHHRPLIGDISGLLGG